MSRVRINNRFLESLISKFGTPESEDLKTLELQTVKPVFDVTTLVEKPMVLGTYLVNVDSENFDFARSPRLLPIATALDAQGVSTRGFHSLSVDSFSLRITNGTAGVINCGGRLIETRRHNGVSEQFIFPQTSIAIGAGNTANISDNTNRKFYFEHKVGRNATGSNAEYWFERLSLNMTSDVVDPSIIFRAALRIRVVLEPTGILPDYLFIR